jgi:deoxyribonuclease-4
MIYGVHISTAGDLVGTPARAAAMGAGSLQIFTGSPRTWRQATYSDEVASNFRAELGRLSMPAFTHMMYLTAYGTPDKELRSKSIEVAKHTLKTADQIGMSGVVTHMGSHKGMGTDSMLSVLKDSLLEAVSDTATMLLMENSAGAGGNVGNSIDELAKIYEATGRSPKIGFCLDTAHLLAAGYEVRTAEGWDGLLKEFDQKIGLDRLKVIHLNDSKIDIGGKVDRHQNIGFGYIGEDGFKHILNHPKVKDLPGILEVPGIDGHGPDKANLDKLKSLTR